jgi:hypothetical protein
MSKLMFCIFYLLIDKIYRLKRYFIFYPILLVLTNEFYFSTIHFQILI